MDYLTQQNRHCEGDDMPWINAAGKHVVIIGGGDTGADASAPFTARAPRAWRSSR